MYLISTVCGTTAVGECICSFMSTSLWPFCSLGDLDVEALCIEEQFAYIDLCSCFDSTLFFALFFFTQKFVHTGQIWTLSLELLPLSIWIAVFLGSYRSSIVNEQNRQEGGLLVLIHPGGSLGITINSQLLGHSTSRHRHCQFVPIRETSYGGVCCEEPFRPYRRAGSQGLAQAWLFWLGLHQLQVDETLAGCWKPHE